MQIELIEHRGVHHTVAVMTAIVAECKTGAWARRVVADLVRKHRLVDSDIQGLCDGVYQWVRERVTYRSDIQGVETVQYPRATIDLGIGDCDDMCVLAATLLQAAGVGTSFMTLGYDGDLAGSHVVVAVRGGDGGVIYIVDCVASPCDTVSTMSGLTFSETY